MVTNPTAFTLDSFALLAYLEGEAGMPRVQAILAAALAGSHTVYLSLINLGEILYIVERERGLTAARRTLAAIDQLPIQVVPVSRTIVLAAAHIKASYPVSYADAFAVVTARDYGAVLVTGDPEFKSIVDAELVAIEWLPRR